MIKAKQSLVGKAKNGALMTGNLNNATGVDGATFFPHIDSEGNLSWTNNGGFVNPETINVKGTQGPQGEQGPKGDQGKQGIQGLQGIPGKDFSIFKTYTSIDEMQADIANIEEGNFVMIASNVEDADNAKLYVKATNEFVYITDLSGAAGMKGEQGPQGVPGEQGPQGMQGEQGEIGESLPIGSIIEYEGNEIPYNWEAVETKESSDKSSITAYSYDQIITATNKWAQVGCKFNEYTKKGENFTVVDHSGGHCIKVLKDMECVAVTGALVYSNNSGATIDRCSLQYDYNEPDNWLRFQQYLPVLSVSVNSVAYRYVTVPTQIYHNVPAGSNFLIGPYCNAVGNSYKTAPRLWDGARAASYLTVQEL